MNLLLLALAAAPAGIRSEVKVGSAAPGVAVSTWWNGGLEESTADFKGAVVLLEFFATW
ncbi:MAG: hypothetical protein L0323_11425 [Planctomycetes bacterium]|jgi:hypothetical protein|nr:hypothetical protein [Planctomycetota bacterium]